MKSICKKNLEIGVTFRDKFNDDNSLDSLEPLVRGSEVGFVS